jgi:hypothetical protein
LQCRILDYDLQQTAARSHRFKNFSQIQNDVHSRPPRLFTRLTYALQYKPKYSPPRAVTADAAAMTVDTRPADSLADLIDAGVHVRVIQGHMPHTKFHSHVGIIQGHMPHALVPCSHKPRGMETTDSYRLHETASNEHGDRTSTFSSAADFKMTGVVAGGVVAAISTAVDVGLGTSTIA